MKYSQRTNKFQRAFNREVPKYRVEPEDKVLVKVIDNVLRCVELLQTVLLILLLYNEYYFKNAFLQPSVDLVLFFLQ